jgi:mRNA interferase RelE/StbE
VKYKLIYTQRGERDLAKLDIKTKERIGKTLLRFQEEPLKYAEKFSDPILGSFRFRIGDYRIIFDIGKSEIVVLRVGHRKEIYRRG